MPIKNKDSFKMGPGSEASKKKEHKKAKRKHDSDDEEEAKSEDDLLPGEKIDDEDDDEDDDESDEEEDDEENNNYEEDGFVVNDVDEEEPEIASAHSSPIKSPVGSGLEEEKEEEDDTYNKKHKKRRDSLDEEDLELIQENMQPKHKRLKKHAAFIDEEDDDIREPELEDEGSFIEDDLPRDDRPKKKRRQPTESTSLLQSIFGSGYQQEEIQEEEGEKEGEEAEDEEEKRKVNKKKLEQIFDPAELQEKFETTADEQIIQMDIPERLQYRYKNKLNEDNDFTLETNWVCDKLMRQKGLVDKNTDNFRKNILKVIEFLRINSYEIMYIYTYKINEISLKPGELKLSDLWRIYELDLEWNGIWSRRRLLEKNLKHLEKFYNIPPYIFQIYNSSGGDQFTLDNLLEWVAYQTNLYADLAPPDMSNFEEDSIKKTKANPLYKPEVREKFENVTENFMINADKLAQYLIDPRSKQPPPFQDNIVQICLENYVDPTIRKIATWKSFMYSYCDFQAQQLFKNPVIRKFVHKMYLDKLLISTEPTAKGKKEIDMYNINFPVKRLNGIPPSQFPPELWLRAVQCEKEGKINIKFGFRWKDINSDEIATYLKDLYLYDQKIKSDASSEWNTLRQEIIQLLLKNLLYPFLEKTVRLDLTQDAEKHVIGECGRKFKEMINASPYTKIVGEKHITKITVISFVPDERDRVFCAVVDKDGNFKDFREYEFLLIREGPGGAPLEHIQKKEFEEKSLKHLIEKHKPDLLVVGAENLAAKRLREYLRNQEKKWDDVKVWVKYGDMTTPKIYAKLDISKKELGDYQVKLREATSLARLQQNPLAEILKLWHYKSDQNGLLFIHFHDLQNQVKTDKLLREFERVAMEVTNNVGIQINRVIKHPHLAAPLQFICGLGPRKAKFVLDTLTAKTDRLQLRRELTDMCVGKLVFTNMAGFINNYVDPSEKEEEKGMDVLDSLEIDPLEITRIHPDNYRLAQKIAKDALDNTSSSDDVVKIIMKNPKKLDELDLDDYAHHLDSKGKQNMKLILDYIVRELTFPFHDPRDSHKEMDDKELFYKMTKMHPFELQRGTLVNSRVTGVDEKYMKSKLECGVGGRIRIEDTDVQGTDLREKFNLGEILQARVKGNNFDEKHKMTKDGKPRGRPEGQAPPDFTIIQLTIKKQDLDNHKQYIPNLHQPLWEAIKNYFTIVDAEDFPQVQSFSNKMARYQPRKINHPKFKNTSVQGALDYLSEKDIGEFLVRPSSKGTDHLTITWKFFDKVYVHLDIKESQKQANEKIGRRLFLKDQQFESLDEIHSGYIEPCNTHVKNIITNPKFMRESADKIELAIKKEKEDNPKLIPYRFGFSVEAPQFLVLYYVPKDYNIITEYIKVKHNGLSFHDNSFPSLPHLISWFKSNYTKPEYHKYLKHTKPPIAQAKQPVLPKTEKMNDRGHDYSMGNNTPTHLGRWEDNNVRVKHEREDIKIKTEKQQFHVKDEPRGGHRDRSNERHKGGRDYRDNRGGDRDRHGGNRSGRKSRSRSNEKSRHGDRRDNRGGDTRGGDRDRDRDRDRDNRGGYDRDNRRGGDRDRNDRGDRDRSDRRGGDDRRQGGGQRYEKENRRDNRPDNRRDNWGGQKGQGRPMQVPVDAWGTEPGEQMPPQRAWGEPGLVKQEDRVDSWGGEPQRNDDMIRVKQEHH